MVWPQRGDKGNAPLLVNSTAVWSGRNLIDHQVLRAVGTYETKFASSEQEAKCLERAFAGNQDVGGGRDGRWKLVGSR